MTHILFVVSRKHRDLLPALNRESRARNVEVMVDRRQFNRRQKSEVTAFPDRRRGERRIVDNSRELDLIGVAVVVIQ